MTARQRLSVARLKRALVSIDHLPLAVKKPRHLVLSIARLRASVQRLEELEQEQFRSSPGRSTEGRQIERLCRVLRREYMLVLAPEGRRMMVQAPGVERAMRVPHARATHPEIVAACEGMIKFVSPYRRLLAEAGFEKSFLAEMREYTRELRRLTTTSSRRQERHRRASQALRRELAAANQMLRIVNALVLALIEREGLPRNMWTGVMRMPKPMGRKKRKPGDPKPERSAPRSPRRPRTPPAPDPQPPAQ